MKAAARIAAILATTSITYAVATTIRRQTSNSSAKHATRSRHSAKQRKHGDSDPDETGLPLSALVSEVDELPEYISIALACDDSFTTDLDDPEFVRAMRAQFAARGVLLPGDCVLESHEMLPGSVWWNDYIARYGSEPDLHDGETGIMISYRPHELPLTDDV
jgi:hypothetical protein